MRCNKPLGKPKPKHRKGLWSPEEDQKLKNYILQHGHGCWSSVPINAGLQRNGKSCRLRWINYLRPGLKRGMFNLLEEETILSLHRVLGNKWSQISQHLPGRTDNEIKNYWHSYLKKRVVKVEAMEPPTKAENSNNSNLTSLESSPSPKKPISQISSFESFEKMERSSTDTDQARRSSLPKLLFAEWLSIDHGNGINRSLMASSIEPENSKDAFDSNFNFQEDMFMHHGLLTDEGSFGSEFRHGLSNGSPDEIFSSQFKVEGENPASEFADFFTGDEICSGFNMNNDLIYL